MDGAYTDKELLTLFRGTEADQAVAQEYTYKAWWKMAIGKLINMRATQNDARDACHEGFIQFVERAQNPDVVFTGPLKAYYMTCVIHQWYRYLKEGKFEDMEFSSEDWVLIQQAEEWQKEWEIITGIRESDQYLSTAIDTVLAMISEKCRTILTLAWLGSKSEEIALQLGYASAEVVRNMKSSCKSRFENSLRQHPGILGKLKDLTHD